MESNMKWDWKRGETLAVAGEPGVAGELEGLEGGGADL